MMTEKEEEDRTILEKTFQDPSVESFLSFEICLVYLTRCAHRFGDDVKTNYSKLTF